MNYTFKDNTAEFHREFEKALRKGLTAIGITAEAHAKREITKLVYSRGEAEKKYRLTGRLRNSITFALSGEEANAKSYTDDEGRVYSTLGTADGKKLEGVYIGTNVEYAPYVEMGTSRMAARPFLRPAATEHAQEYKRLMEAAMKGRTSE